MFALLYDMLQSLDWTRQLFFSPIILLVLFLLYQRLYVHISKYSHCYSIMLIKYLIWQLVIYINFVLFIIHMQIITVGQIFTLNFLQKIFTVFYRSVNCCQFTVSVHLKIVSCLFYLKKIQLWRVMLNKRRCMSRRLTSVSYFWAG